MSQQRSKPKRKTLNIPTTTTTPTPSEFSFAIARIAVSQITQSLGFKSTNPSALETLTHVAVKYMEAVATASASYAALANRTNTNILDFTNALQDLQSVQGFKGAAFLHKDDFCVLGSSVLSDLGKFVRWNEETPFARPIPRAEEMKGIPIPIPREVDFQRDLHVPRWVPAFPDVKKVVGKRRNGEELWEDMLIRSNGGGSGGDGSGFMNESEMGNGSGGNEKGFYLEMGKRKKMGRVRFRIGGAAAAVAEEEKGNGVAGVNLRSGVCRGGKRVSWENSKIVTKFNTRRIHEFVDDDDDKT